ncbi:MAG: RHS repeat domain-containing protein, partial [Bacteroidota bacterium]
EFHFKLHNNGVKAIRTDNEITYGGIALTGGHDPQNTYDYCEDDSSYPPKGADVRFEIPSDGYYDVHLNVSTTGNNANNSFQHVFIYPTSGLADGECIDTILGPLCGDDQPRGYCQLNNSSDVVYRTFNSSPNTSRQVPVYLTAGAYRIFMLNSGPDTHASALVKGVEEELTFDIDFVGGLKAYKIIDKTDDTHIAQTKYYYYNDISKLDDFSGVDQQFLEANEVSSAVLHTPAKFLATTVEEKIGTDPGQPLEFTCETTIRFSSNRSLQNAAHIAYNSVTEIMYTEEGEMLFTVSEFHNESNSSSGIPFHNRNPLNGMMMRQSIYETTDTELKLVSEQINHYSKTVLGGTLGFLFQSDVQSESYIVYRDGGAGEVYYDYKKAHFEPQFGTIVHCGYHSDHVIKCIHGPISKWNKRAFNMTEWWIRLDTTITVNYDGATPLVDKTSFTYENQEHYQVTSTEKTNSDGARHAVKMFYAHETSQDDMIADHMIAIPVKTEVLKDDQIISTKITHFERAIDAASGEYMILPNRLSFSTYNQSPETRVQYHQYVYGNPVEVSKIDGKRTVYIWGYNYTLPIAKIDFATYDDIVSRLTVSVDELQSMTPAELTTELSNLRSQLNGYNMVTSYVYEPQIGIKSVTDPAGQSISYEYDWLNRLKLIRDTDGNILETYEYRYANED